MDNWSCAYETIPRPFFVWPISANRMLVAHDPDFVPSARRQSVTDRPGSAKGNPKANGIGERVEQRKLENHK